MGNFQTVGILAIMLSAVLFYQRNRSRGEVNGECRGSKLKIRGPIWFILMMVGLFLILIDSYIPS